MPDAKNRGSHTQNWHKKVMFLDKLKKDNSIISLEMPLYAPVIHLRVALPMDAMAVSMAIRSWIPSPIHTASSSSFIVKEN